MLLKAAKLKRIATPEMYFVDVCMMRWEGWEQWEEGENLGRWLTVLLVSTFLLKNGDMK